MVHKVKLLILQDTSNYAGTESHILTLSNALSYLDGVEIELLVPRGSELEKRSQRLGLKVHVSRPSLIAFLFR